MSICREIGYQPFVVLGITVFDRAFIRPVEVCQAGKRELREVNLTRLRYVFLRRNGVEVPSYAPRALRLVDSADRPYLSP